ncbi:Clp protease ClpP [Lactiplantibacillus plantarum]|uniref:head maturation protease, ClpP-related n=1 Tax=Lactiplantibacillus plantarum TaxID=1590 RepID=UPI001C663575|nr:head maturation protease, ClpP-related [Lactiplantibacillus plantarum]MCT3223560.1 Clp protease ClpP [Lactiplantibacillus plantarum]QYC98901.1 Clp protease ClpP [Lactiplantibacillus plantarum]
MKKINVKGPIISNDDKWLYDYLGMEATAPKDVIDVLPSDGSDVEIDINSGGGLVDSGNEIYTALMAYQGKVTVNVVGMAASSASLIAMAGRPTRISPVGQIMIHNVAGGWVGDYRDQVKLSEILKQSSEAIANAYHLKTGLSMEDLQAKMDSETYLNANQAKELGFVDEIMFDDQVELVADGGSGMLPKAAVDKIAELMKKNNSGMTTARSIKPFKLSDSDIDRITTAVAQKLNVKPTKQAENSFTPFAF